MPKQLNVDLRFNADTSQAKKQIQDLQQTLSKLGSSSSKSLGFDQMNSEIAQATNQVNILKTQLDRAFNTQTGKLDLTKFTQDMQKSGMSLEKYRDALMKLGPEGSQAFAKLATSISQAEIPLRRTNKLLTEMGTVLKNTIKWQISSSAIHGFMGAIQQAYGYAQDLNESLTNIQIVTQHDAEYMAAFADRANRAAQALSTTTTAYTDAALIFYQQGLDDKSVEERTNATIKMAQVTGDSAQEVSSYMTAIWNNFDDGSESLEHYADVITALGAATASSSAEISQGLEKFASIADTVGLSYEYATTALATVVAQTRQSADVVGTAFKTMFARIQDLELGKTLEDGVDLGQYSKALTKVGVDVMDANGQLRAMDDILDDIGQRWGELGEAERVALAQNVAGQRQYAQFMAIFENWGTFQENLKVANASDGTLQEQADIYAKSWEASQKRVRAAMEGIYQSIINDDFFIDLNDNLAKTLNGVNNLIKAFGGLPGILSMVSAIMLRTFSSQAAEGIRNMAMNIQLLFGGREKIQAQQKTALALAKDAFVDDSISAQLFQNKLTLQEKYLQNAEKLNELEEATVKLGMQQLDNLTQQAVEAEKRKKEAEEEQEIIIRTLREQAVLSSNTLHDRRELVDALRTATTDYDNAVLEINKYDLGEIGDFTGLDSLASRGVDLVKNGYTEEQFQKLKNEAVELAGKLNLSTEAKKKLDQALAQKSPSLFATDLRSALYENNIEIERLVENKDAAEGKLREAFQNITHDEEKAEAMLLRYVEAVHKGVSAEDALNQVLTTQEERIKTLNEYMQNASGNQIDWAQRIVNGAQAMMQVSMAISQIKGIITTIQDKNMSGLDKMLSIMTSLGMVVPMLVNSYRNLTIIQQVAKISQLDLNKTEADSVILLSVQQKQLGLLNAAKMLGITITDKMTVADLKEAITAKTQGKSHWGIVKALTAQSAATLAAYWPLLLLAAAIAAVVGAIKYYQYTQESSLKHTENAIKAAENLKNQYEEMKSSYEDLKSVIEDYSGAEEALEKLAKGTAEWASALVNANDQAREIIDTLNLIQGQDWVVDENGFIQINDSSLERGQQEQSQQMVQSHATAMMAEAYAAFSDIENVVYDYRQQINEDYREQMLAASQMGPDAQNEISRLTRERNRLLQEVEDNYGAEYEAGLTNYNATASIAAQELLTQNSNYLYSSDEIQNLVAGASINGYNNLQAYHNYLDAARSRGGLFNSQMDPTSREVVERYARESGLYDLADFNIKNYKANGQVEYTYTDESGEEQTGLINPQDVASFLSAADAADNLANNIDNLITVFSSLTNSANGADQALLSFLSQQNMERLNAGEFASAQQEIETDNIEGISYDEASAYLSSQAEEIGFSLEEMASMAGYQSAYSYVNSFAEGMNNASDAWDDVNSSGWLDTFDETVQSNLSLGAATRIDNLISTLSLGPAGEAIGQELVDGMNTMLQDLDEDDIALALNQLTLIDWTSYDALENAANVMHEFGVEIDTSSEYWLQFADDMRIASGAIPDYTQLRQELQDINTILENLDFGKVISDADYAKLVAYNDEWERFFLMQSNGNRIFIGDSQQLINTERARIVSLQQEVNARQQLAEQFDGTWGWNHEDGSSTAANWGQINSSNIDWEGTVSNLQSHIGSGDVTDQILTDLGYDVESLSNLTADQFDELTDRLNNYIHEDFAQANQELMEMYASTATDFYELNTMMSDGIINNEAYQKQSEYLLNTISSVEQLEDAYSAGYIALEQYNEALDEVIKRQAEAFGLEGDSVLVQAQEMAEVYNLEAGAAARLALQNQLMNRGVSTLSQNWENWREELETTDYTTQDYADTVVDVTAAIKDLVGIVDDNFTLSSGFLKEAENLELLEQAAQGSEEAIERLGVSVAHDLVENLEAVDFNSLTFDNEEDKGKFAHIFDGFEDNKNTVLSGLEQLQEQINSLEIGDDVTAILGDEWISALNDMALATQMSVSEMNDMLNSIGVEADVVTRREPQMVEVPIYETTTTVTKPGDPETGDGRVVQTTTQEIGTKPMKGYVEVAQINTGDKIGTAPSASRLTYSGNGGVSSSAVSGRPSGGGGSPKSGSKKDKKDPTGEIERYHVINNQIEDNEKALNQLSKAKDRAYGKARLNAMDAEIAKQRESVELAERKLQEVEKYLELDAGAIAAFGAEFDTNGTIVNYDQLMQEQIDKYNAAVEAYNNGPMDENAEALFQQAEDDYNAFLEALKQYEETQDLWYEQAQAVADAKAQVLQLELEKTAYKVEIGIEWEEDDINRLDFLLKRIEDDAFKAAEAIGLLGEKTVDAMDKFNIYKQGFADVLSNLGVTNPDDIINRAMQGEDLYGMLNGIVDPAQMAQAVEQMNDYIAQMMSSLEQAQEAVDAAFEKVRDLFNENVKQMDTYIEKIEFCQKITKSYMNIVDIVGKKSLGITNEMLRTFNDQSVTQAVANETAAKAKMDSIEAQLNESRERLAQATTEKEKEYWEKLIAEQEKELITATENFHQAWEDALQANLEAYENNLELMIEDFSDAVGDLNAMRSEWDLQKSLTDMWEPEFERWHQLSTLISDINKSVEGNENLKYKNELLDLEKEIEGLQEEEAKLSEYDLNYLRLRYEAKLAEIALEEAQNAKSQVRMSRDSEGNYSYVYTADEEAVNNAADDYRNKIYEMEKANEEYIDTLQQQLMDMHDKMLEDIKEAGDLYGYGTQEYIDAVARIEETYYAKSEFIQQQMQNVFDNNQRLRDEDIVDYVQYTGDIAAANVDLQMDFGDTFMGIQTGCDDLNTYFNETWLPSLRETFDNVIAKTQEYNERNEEIMNAAGTSMSEFGDLARSEIESVTDATSDLAKQTEEYGDSAADAFAEAAQAWQNGPAQLLESIQAQMDAVANLAQQYINLKSQLDAAAESARALAAAMNQPVRSYTPTSVIPSGGTGGGNSGGGNSNDGGNSGNGEDNESSITPPPGAGNAFNALVQQYQKARDEHRWSDASYILIQIREFQKRYPGYFTTSFASGGYTGEWGDDGRLAVLHQKELVLNAQDTTNILSAVDVVRQLASSIDLNTMAANLIGTSINLASGSAGTIEQKVEISASFPSVTDRNEIEQAFNNLVNNASQYANRKD